MTSFVIVENAYGSYSTYEATMDNAMSIFENNVQNMDYEIVKIATDDSIQYVDNARVVQVIAEMLKAQMKEPLPKMRNFLYGMAPKEGNDLRPDVVKTKAMLQELSLFMVENNLTQEMFQNNRYFTDVNFIESLDFFAPFKERIGKPVKVTYSDYLDMAHDYNTIVNKKWKSEAAENKVVERILQFVNQYLVDSSDIKYNVAPLNKNFA